MKIVGVVNGNKEAEDIEEIVKVFVIKQRISSLLPNKVIENVESKNIISPLPDTKYFEKSNVTTINERVENYLKPLFNVRGIN